MSKRLGAVFWRKHLDGWAQSGLTQVGYCARHGLSLKTFHRWLRRERKGESTIPAPITLVPVAVERSSVGSTMQIHSPGGWRIEVAGASVAHLAELLKVLP